MTAAETFIILQVLLGAFVGWKADRNGLVILNSLFIATIAIMLLMYGGSGEFSNSSASKIWTFALIAAGFCVPMTLAYYATNFFTSDNNAAIASALSKFFKATPFAKVGAISAAGNRMPDA